MGSAAPKRRLESERRRSVAMRPPIAAVGALAMIVAGWGSVALAGPTDPGVLASDQRALSDSYETGPDVSRDFDRVLLEQQTQAQAEQLIQAQAEVRSDSQAKADELQIEAEARRANQWVLPVTGYRISGRFGDINSLYGKGHSGLDLAGPSGSTVVSVAAGTVIAAKYSGNCGNMTQIKLDAQDLVIMYCHQSRITVEVGQHVQAGETVGYTGSTGRSTGPHLHVEAKPGGGKSVDVEPYFREHNVTV